LAAAKVTRDNFKHKLQRWDQDQLPVGRHPEEEEELEEEGPLILLQGREKEEEEDFIDKAEIRR
jgi:hypothetical protein